MPAVTGWALLAFLLALFFVPLVAAQGFYGAPSFTAERTRVGMAPRAHSVVIVDQCQPASSPRYFIWGGVKDAAMTPVSDAWYTDDGYTFNKWYEHNKGKCYWLSAAPSRHSSHCLGAVCVNRCVCVLCVRAGRTLTRALIFVLAR